MYEKKNGSGKSGVLPFTWQFRFTIPLASLVDNLIPEIRHLRFFIILLSSD